jgi:hypothetical protein
MPETAPPGIFPLYLRNTTCEKYGLKTGEGISDLVDYKLLKKEEVMKDISLYGATSDFEPGKKKFETYQGDQILVVVDRDQKYGETFLFCYTEEARENYMRTLSEAEEALKAQLLAEQKAEEDRIAAEYARKNVVYEDKPITPRPWIPHIDASTEREVQGLSHIPSRELLVMEVSRPKNNMKQKYKFTDRNADNSVLVDIRSIKDPNFRHIKESDFGIQVAPTTSSSSSQTTWNKSVNKSIQYESTVLNSDPLDGDSREQFLTFLEKATVKIEEALQQNESVDIFHETFRLLGDDAHDNVQADSELKELRNFADPNYSKMKALIAVDWVPKATGLVAVSAVSNVSFDDRIPSFGQSNSSHILVWDFRLLVKPLILMQSNHDIFTFRFNRTDPGMVAGGCITGQVVLWEVGDAIQNALRKNSRGSSVNNSSGGGAAAVGGSSGLQQQQQLNEEEEDSTSMCVMPKYVSSADHSHKKCVADLFWLPPTTQINYRGQLVADEHLDGHSYQFVTVAGDGMILVWDTRFERIANDELRHIGRAKHAPTEKSSSKDGGNAPPKPVWWPIFSAHLKRLDGVGELSLCKFTPLSNPKDGQVISSRATVSEGDHRSHFTVTTEEGDILFADLSARKTAKKQQRSSGVDEEEDDDDEAEVSCMKWISVDHPRPAVCLQESPFFPQIFLSVGDWNFHIWKV